MSKMNKKDLYTHAKELKADLETQIFFNNTLEEEIEYMKDHQMENTKLKEENTKLKLEVEKYDGTIKYIKELEGGNERLKERLLNSIYKYKHDIKIMAVAIKELKEENEKLKKEDWSKKYALKIDYQKILDENKKLTLQMTSMCSEQADSDCAKYIKELKEEIEYFKSLKEDPNWECGFK
tara:strand:- start:23 stop:562 length:540 start_codon:yes stop_codon:yes gene_type:complete